MEDAINQSMASASSSEVELGDDYTQNHHSLTGLPIHECEDKDVDSEEEQDPEWLRDKFKRGMNEFVDVNDEEKGFMTLWNLHRMKYPSVQRDQLPLVFENFVKCHGMEIAQKELVRNFYLHLVNLYSSGFLTARQFDANILQLNEMAIKAEKLKKLLTGKHDGVLYHSLETAASSWCSEREPIIAIDFGMTYSRVAVFQDKKVMIINNALGEDVTPSYITFNVDGTTAFGQAAKENAYINPGITVSKLKALMSETLSQSQFVNASWPVRLIVGQNGLEFEVHGRRFALEMIVSVLFRELKVQAERVLGRPVLNAVITVPAYSSQKQIVATSVAASLTGLKVISILPEPVAALIAFQRPKEVEVRNVLVFDWGCQRLELTILALNHENGRVQVLHANEDWSVGSSKFDNKMLNYCLKEFGTPYNIHLPEFKEEGEAALPALCRLQAACEQAKVQLDTKCSVTVEMDSFFRGKDLSVRVTREVFEALNKDLFQKIIGDLKEALSTAGLKKEDIHDILPVGMSTRIPKIQSILSEYFNGKTLNQSMPPNYPVVYGAAIHGALLNVTSEVRTTSMSGGQAETNETSNSDKAQFEETNFHD